MARAALDRLDLRLRHQHQHVARLQSEVLHAQVTGHVIADLAELAREVGAQQARLVARPQILERIEHRVAHLLHLRVVRKHQRQLLLEHQRARGHGRHDVPALVDQSRQLGNVLLLQLLDRLEIAHLQLRHAAAALLRRDRHGDAVVLEDRGEILAQVRLVAIAVAGREQHDLAPSCPPAASPRAPDALRAACRLRYVLL